MLVLKKKQLHVLYTALNFVGLWQQEADTS